MRTSICGALGQFVFAHRLHTLEMPKNFKQFKRKWVNSQITEIYKLPLTAKSVSLVQVEMSFFLEIAINKHWTFSSSEGPSSQTMEYFP